MKTILSLIFLLLCGKGFATTRLQAEQIYEKILKANHISVAPLLRFSSSREVNAHTQIYSITIDQGMLDATNVDELAWVIGHELGHFRLGHTRSTHANEYAADAWGWYYAQKAGYNMCKAKNLLKKFHKGASSTHPDPIDRIKRLPRC